MSVPSNVNVNVPSAGTYQPATGGHKFLGIGFGQPTVTNLNINFITDTFCSTGSMNMNPIMMQQQMMQQMQQQQMQQMMMGFGGGMGMVPGFGGCCCTQGSMFNGMAQMQQQLQMMMMLLQMMMMQQQNGFGGGCGCNVGGGFNFGAIGGGFDVGGVNAPYNAGTGNAIADTAAAWNGKHYKPGQSARCADFVSTMIMQSGKAPAGFKPQMSCSELQKYGTPVGSDQLKPGDMVFFGNTYKAGQYTHVGIYLGDGKFVHRPGADKPVKVDNLNSNYYKSHYSGARRLQ